MAYFSWSILWDSMKKMKSLKITLKICLHLISHEKYVCTEFHMEICPSWKSHWKYVCTENHTEDMYPFPLNSYEKYVCTKYHMENMFVLKITLKNIVSIENHPEDKSHPSPVAARLNDMEQHYY